MRRRMARCKSTAMPSLHAMAMKWSARLWYARVDAAVSNPASALVRFDGAAGLGDAIRDAAFAPEECAHVECCLEAGSSHADDVALMHRVRRVADAPTPLPRLP